MAIGAKDLEALLRDLLDDRRVVAEPPAAGGGRASLWASFDDGRSQLTSPASQYSLAPTQHPTTSRFSTF
jgi:hypothetical protein